MKISMRFLHVTLLCSGLFFLQTPVSADIANQQAWDSALPQYKLDTITESLNDSIQGSVINYGDNYAWDASYWIRALVMMADTYNDSKYLSQASNIIDSVLSNRDDERAKRGELAIDSSTYTKAPLSYFRNPNVAPPCWRRVRQDSDRGNVTVCDVLIDGQIVQAIMRFADLIRRQSQFSAYRSKADNYVNKAKETIDAWNDSFIYDRYKDGKIPGSYYWPNKQNSELLDGQIPFNQSAVMAAALLLLDDYLGGGTEYRKKAAAVAALWQQHRDAKYDVAIWYYDLLNHSLGVEDVNHAQMDLSFLVLAYKYGLMSTADMNSIAAVFTDRVYQNDHQIAKYIDGSAVIDIDPEGGENTAVDTGYDWLDLCEFNHAIYDRVASIYSSNYANPSWSRPFLGWANLLYWKGILGR